MAITLPGTTVSGTLSSINGFAGGTLAAPASLPAQFPMGAQLNAGTFFYESAQGGITATGTNQATAFPLTSELNTVTTVALNTGVVLPASTAGLTIFVSNTSTNPLAIYGAGSDTVDGYAFVTAMPGSSTIFACSVAGAWTSNGIGTGYFGSLPTVSFTNSIAAAGTSQGTGTALYSVINRVTTSTPGTAFGVVLPISGGGLQINVLNASANTIAIYPNSSDVINNQAAANPLYLAANSVAEFFCTVAGVWHTQVTNNVPIQFSYTTSTSAVSFTATAANIYGGGAVETDLNLTGTLTGAATITLPTAAATIAGIQNAITNQTYKLRIINSSSGAFAWTVTTNTGWTLNGTMTIAQNTWRDFIVTVTSGTTLTLQSVGTGTYS